MKFPTKRIFRIFRILKIDRITSFCYSYVCVCVQHSCIFNNDRHLTYTCVYSPTMEGQYKVTVIFAEREIPKSPFLVNVSGDASKVTVEGPGVDGTGVVQVNKMTSFNVHTTGQSSVCLSVTQN